MTLVKNDKAWHLQLRRDLKSGKHRPMFPKTGECKVKVCNATTCKENENKKCTLSSVNILDNGVCEQFEE
tara:strand:+ start:7120 stop:7329 length:210 start_codon:yes stop_codon:yes gene_type:complete